MPKNENVDLTCSCGTDITGEKSLGGAFSQLLRTLLHLGGSSSNGKTLAFKIWERKRNLHRFG